MEKEDYEDAPCLRAVDSALEIADAVLRARHPGTRPTSREAAEEIITVSIPEYENGWHAQAELIFMGRADPDDEARAREIARKAYPDGPAAYREAVDLARASIFRGDEAEFAKSLEQGLAREIGIEPEWLIARAIARARGCPDDEAVLEALRTPSIPELEKARQRLEDFGRAMGESASEDEVAEKLVALHREKIPVVEHAFGIADEVLCSVSDEQILLALADRHAETLGKADRAVAEKAKVRGRRP